MIDTHCHLDRCDDLAAALDNELRAMVTIGTDPARCREAVRLAVAEPRVFAAVGIHPNDATLADDGSVLAEIEALADHPRVVAIGETGFDTHWDDAPLAAQRRSYDAHAAMARRLDRPLIVHVRDAQGADDASRAAVDALRAHPDVRGVLHCFNGHADLLAAGVELGWMVSFAGNLTYPSATVLREAAAAVPEDRLLVETDAPFLAPVPKRGKRNLPGWVAYTAHVLAEVRGVPADELERRLDGNAERFYRLPSSL